MVRRYSIDQRRIIDDDAYEARRKGSGLAPFVAVVSLLILVFAAFIVLGNQTGTNVNNVFNGNGEAGIGGGPEEVIESPLPTKTPTLTPTKTPTPTEVTPTISVEETP